jgi:hypothetical protein
MLNPIAAENGPSLNRRVRSAELIDLHDALEDLLGNHRSAIRR